MVSFVSLSFLQCQLLHLLYPTKLEGLKRRVGTNLIHENVFPVLKLCANTDNASNMTQKDITTTSWSKKKDTGDTEKD